MTENFDAIIIGGGHNGLVCGAYLARNGLKVKVLERRHIVGGAAVTEEFHPGYRASTFSYLMSLLHPKVIRELELKKHGLEVLPCSDMYSPLDDDYIVFSDDVKKTQKQFGRFNKHDAGIYPEFDKYIGEAANVVRQLLFDVPPDPSKTDFKSLKELAGFAWKYRKIGNKLYRLIDLLTMSAEDFLRQWFDDTRIRAVLAYYASIGTFVSPRTPGSAYVIIHHIMGEHEGAGGWGFIKGGMGAITQAIASYGRTVGMDVEVDAEVDKIIVEDGRAVGVALKNGREYRAKVVASNAAAPVTFLKLIDEKELPAEFVRDIRNYRTRSSAFKMNVACERLPQYKGLQKALDDGALGSFTYPTYIHIAPDIEYLDKAYTDAKDGWYSTEPFITPVSPTIVDKTLAPPGKHVLNLFGGHAASELKGSTWAAEKDNLVKNTLNTMDRFAPGFSNDIIAMDVLTPDEIEKRVALPSGHIFHGELAPDQLFFKRPVKNYANYRSPLKGLYQCGSSAHPGGGVSGIPGHNAAREILKDNGKKMR
ncbi:phytoene desaturase family protein [Shinella sumterensis]|uniref:Pyridine nucleotide-disulfide oxidoreductase domain-containing protein 2 n=1 Tax=Shinella sumterensis TaxID=1967501 RepID=A0AA50DGU4_9HYPH|nr:NAD(P)/FAD-dependent oxidoreductase [Shinella sumterensis]WLS01072.1 NAD(P)/FAD-dependent oxidoreductase [Shinella sumterensis]WLS11868.1 NAD(P)/FAD-dependent oxidoreductase [Shinella sumterensis]